jgi:hypothetical protein
LAPMLVSATAVNSGGSARLNDGDSIVFVFGISTDYGGILTPTQSEVDDLVSVSGGSLGAAYSGAWSTTTLLHDTLTVTVSDVTGASLVPGATSFGLVATYGLKDGLTATSNAAVGGATVLGGTFTSVSIVSVVGSDGGSNQDLGVSDMITIVFSDATNRGGAAGQSISKSEIDSLLSLGGGAVGSSNLGSDYSGEWSTTTYTDDTLTITEVDIASAHLVPGVTTFAVKSSGGLRDRGLTTSGLTGSVTLTGAFGAAPRIVSATAHNTDLGVGLGSGDSFTIVWDSSTNKGGSGTSNVNGVFIANLLGVQGPYGLDATGLSGVWSTTSRMSDTLTVTIGSIGSTSLVVGTTVFSMSDTGSLQDMYASSGVSTSVNGMNAVLGGSFTTAPNIVSVTAVHSGGAPGPSTGDSLVIDFNQGTSQSGSMNQAAIDLLFDFGSSVLGAAYSGVWSTAVSGNDRITITMSDVSGCTIVPGVSSVSVKGSGNLRDTIGTSDVSTSGPVVIGGTLFSAPFVTSVSGVKIGTSNTAGTHDKIVVTFNTATNGGLAVNVHSVVSGELDLMFTVTGGSLGTDYSGVWDNSLQILTITFGLDTSGLSLTPGVTTFALKSSGLVHDSSGTSPVSDGSLGSVVLDGVLNLAPMLVSATAVNSGGSARLNDGDSIVFVFGISTD